MAGLWFEELTVGRVVDAEWSRTVAESDNIMFCALTMNVQKLHLDAEFAGATEYGRPLGTNGNLSQSRANLPSISNLPFLVMPFEATPAFSFNRFALVRSLALAERSEKIAGTASPSSAAAVRVGTPLRVSMCNTMSTSFVGRTTPIPWWTVCN